MTSIATNVFYIRNFSFPFTFLQKWSLFNYCNVMINQVWVLTFNKLKWQGATLRGRKTTVLKFGVSTEFATEALLIICMVHKGTVGSQFFCHYDIRIICRLSGQAECIHSPTRNFSRCVNTMLAVVFHSPQLTKKSMKLALHCIFSHINNIYTMNLGTDHSENHWQSIISC